MPELPEVDTIRRQLDPLLSGRVVHGSWAFPSGKFTSARHADGAGIERIRRRGKYLLVELDDDRELVVHLGMTGALRVRDAPSAPHLDDPYVRAWWSLAPLDTGPTPTLVFRDVRRFGRIAVVDRGDYRSLPTLHGLGPEPFDDRFDGDHLWRSVRSSHRFLKTQLLSQRVVAGIGNIYADEALWLAGVNPADRTLSRQRATRLVETIREALSSGLRHGGTTLRDYVDADGSAGTNQHHLSCYGRGGEACERCGDTLRRRTLDARTTTWCPTCQPPRR